MDIEDEIVDAIKKKESEIELALRKSKSEEEKKRAEEKEKLLEIERLKLGETARWLKSLNIAI